MQPIKIDFSGAISQVSKDDIKKAFSKLHGIDHPFMRLPEDKKTLDAVKLASDAVRCKFQNLMVLGIGGSALGFKCLAQALLPPFFNMLDGKGRRGSPRIFVMDNIDPDVFAAAIKLLDWRETCVNVVSKSGKTTETLAQFYIIKDILVRKFGAKGWGEHVIVTTDPNSGPLRAVAAQEKLQSFSVPVDVGGRFSVFSPVGLLPAACAGIDVAELLKGAAAMTERAKSIGEANPAFMNAVVHYLLHTAKHKNISVMMPYCDRLALFSDWYAQLWAESLGKKGLGPTPVKAVGVTDQHSQLQLYMEGPDDKVITIVGVESFKTKISVTNGLPEDYSYLAGKDLGEIFRVEQKATALALQKASKPVVTVTLPDLSERSLGQLLMMYQIQTAVSGLLYGVNPFDQPGVELGKRLTREILAKNSG